MRCTCHRQPGGEPPNGLPSTVDYLPFDDDLALIIIDNKVWFIVNFGGSLRMQSR